MMNRVLYNVTVSIDRDIENDWLEWMTDIHIPEVMRTGFFLENRICRVHAFEQGGLTYAIQYIAKSMHDYDRYVKECAAGLQKKHQEKFGGKFEAFRTVLEIVYEKKAPFYDVYP